MEETKKICKNCGERHPIWIVSGIKKNIRKGCWCYEGELEEAPLKN